MRYAADSCYLQLVVFYKVTMNTELLSTESVFLGKIQGWVFGRLWSTHFINISTHNLVSCAIYIFLIFIFRTPVWLS